MKKVIMLTNGFPYIGGEKSLVRYEYEAISKSNKVVICAITSESQRQMGLDKTVRLTDNTDVYAIDAQLSKVDYLKAFKAVVSGVFWKEEIEIVKRRYKIVESTYKALEFWVLAKKYLEYVKSKAIIEDDEEILVYSFWNTFYTLAFCMLSDKSKNIKIASRYHGYDLYDYRVDRVKRQPFKKWMNARIVKKIFVSQEGYDYYIEKYPTEIDDSEVIHLGVPIAENKPNGQCSRDILRIVSCSRMIPLKRIDMIVSALSQIDDKYHVAWTHYGDGEACDSVGKLAEMLLAKKSNVSYIFAGNVDNDELLRVYEQGNIHCLISTSSNEGLPVSIMEAFSRRIPVIATNVNGVGEAVRNHVNGILLDANPSIEQVVKAIESIARMEDADYYDMQEKAYKTWEDEFDAMANAEKLANCLEEII